MPHALDPQALLVFAAIARAGSVRKAAAVLATPRSTVSRPLAELEDQVGGPLAVRTTRRFALTELGRALASEAHELEGVLGRAADLVRRAAREPTGTLRIAAAPVIGEEVLPEILAALAARHPRLAVDVQMSASYVDLRRGDVDLALRTGPLEDATDLFAVKLGTSTTGCWASPSYLAARGTPRAPADLARHECLVVGGPRTIWSFAGGVRVPVGGRLRMDSFRLARALAVRGVGITRTARMFAAQAEAAGELVPVLEPHWPKSTLYAVHAGTSPPEPKVQAVLALLREAIPRALART